VDHQNFSAPASALVNPEIERARATYEKAADHRRADADARAAGANAAGSQSIRQPMSALSPEMAALLAAVSDALDLPFAATIDDRRTRAELLGARAGDARSILDAVIRGDDITDCTDQFLRWTVDRPVTYTVWVPAQVQDGGQS
jgi:hypothetical protein